MFYLPGCGFDVVRLRVVADPWALDRSAELWNDKRTTVGPAPKLNLQRFDGLAHDFDGFLMDSKLLFGSALRTICLMNSLKLCHAAYAVSWLTDAKPSERITVGNRQLLKSEVGAPSSIWKAGLEGNA